MFKINKQNLFWIPTEDEWYKAAYYDPTLNDGAGGYWNYATRSNDAPTPVDANSVGDVIINSVNYNSQANWNGTLTGHVTTVGSNGGSSFYGTYDQNGNVWEWNDLAGSGSPYRGVRGGNFSNDAINLIGYSDTYSPSFKGLNFGFRIASLNNPLSLSNFAIVGNSGNPNHQSGYGQVNYIYQISKYEITNDEYVSFLNSVAASDNYGLFDPLTSSTVYGGILRIGTSGSYTYEIKENMSQKPVVYVSWFDCARYCNWLHNGKPSGTQNNSTTEDGSYSLNGAITGNAVAKNVNAQYYIPTENEWYKAAYYDPFLNNGSGGYWTYATRSNTVPVSVLADNQGNGIVNFANYARTANWQTIDPSEIITSGNVTTVGTNGGPSYYGTFDQTGNVTEWNDAITMSGSGRGLRGGDWEDTTFANISASGGRRTINNEPAIISSDIGFRVCSSTTYNDSDFVLIEDINNVADTAGFGSVNYVYKIGKYEVTNDEYVEFLNSVGKNDIYNIYFSGMTSSGRGGIVRNGSSGNYSYVVKQNMGNKPVNHVSWFSCARYCNWLTNGKPVGSQNKYTTEDGTYSLNSANTTEIIIKNNFSPFSINTKFDINQSDIIIAESNFSNSTDGWTAEPSGTVTLTPQNTLTIAVDDSAGWNWIKAPSSFISAKPKYGSSIRYRVRRLPSVPGAAPFYPSRVALVGNNVIIIANGSFPTTTFDEYVIPFVAGSFRVTSLQNPDAGSVATEQQIKDVLNSLTNLYLSVDFTNALGANDSSEWDYIRLFNKLAFRVNKS